MLIFQFNCLKPSRGIRNKRKAVESESTTTNAKRVRTNANCGQDHVEAVHQQDNVEQQPRPIRKVPARTPAQRASEPNAKNKTGKQHQSSKDTDDAQVNPGPPTKLGKKSTKSAAQRPKATADDGDYRAGDDDESEDDDDDDDAAGSDDDGEFGTEEKAAAKDNTRKKNVENYSVEELTNKVSKAVCWLTAILYTRLTELLSSSRFPRLSRKLSLPISDIPSSPAPCRPRTSGRCSGQFIRTISLP